MSILRKVGVVSAMTAVSRVFGLVREIVMAHFFGTSALQSAFVIAFRIPNLFRRLFGEGALGAAFIPVFAEIERTEGRARAQLFLSRILGLLVCALALLVGLGIAATYAVQFAAEPGGRWDVAMPLTRIMLPYALFICVAAIVSAVLNVRDRFAVPSLTPVILNLCWIGALVGVCPFLDSAAAQINVVCWGILFAGLAQILFQLPALCAVGYHLRFTFTGWRASPYVRQVLLQMGPASLGIALAQINICIDGWLAYYGAPWAPSALEYADRIIYLPLGLFGTAFATVLLPTFSKQAAAADRPALIATLERSLRNLFVLMAPMAIGLIALATPIVALLYQRGAFDAQSTLWTARAVTAYALGLIAFSSAKTVIPVFYAHKDLKTPVKVAAWCILGNFLLNLASVLFLPEGWRHVGIALSTVLNSFANTAILLAILWRRGLRPNLAALAWSAIRAFLAATLMGLAVWAAHTWLAARGFSLFLTVPCAIALGGILYLILARLLVPAELRELLADLPLRRRRR